MVSNDLRMWIMGGSNKEAPVSSGQKNVGFLPVVALAQYALEDTEQLTPESISVAEEIPDSTEVSADPVEAPEPVSMAEEIPDLTEVAVDPVEAPESVSMAEEIPDSTEVLPDPVDPVEVPIEEALNTEEDDESPIQHEEILESEPIPYLEISRMDDELEERAEELREILRRKLEEKHGKQKSEALEEKPQLEEPKDPQLNEILVEPAELDDKSRIDLLTQKFRKTRKSKVSQVRRNRLLIALVFLIVCVTGVWWFLSSEDIDTAPSVAARLSDTVAPQFNDGYVFKVPFVPPKPLEPPKYGPLISKIPVHVTKKPQQNIVAEGKKPTQRQPASKQPKPVQKTPKPTYEAPQKTQQTGQSPKPVRPVPVDMSVKVTPSLADDRLFEDIRNREYRKAIAQSRENIAKNPQDRLSLFALGLALYGISDFSGARDVFYECLLLDSPRVPNITVGNFSLMQNATNRRIPISKSAFDDIAPLLRATQINPYDRALYINLALSNLKSSSSMNTAKLYNTIFSHAEKCLIQEYGDTLEYYPNMPSK